MIIFDELKYAENIIKNGYKGKKYVSYDNIILVKYLKYKGWSEIEIRNFLRNMMVDYEYLFNRNILERKINRAMNKGMKYDLLTGIDVEITDGEIKLINSLDKIELRKMMFVLLVVWKFRGMPKRFKISNEDLMKLSQVRVNNSTFWNYIYQITQTKMLSMVEYKNKSYYRIHIDTFEENSILKINDFDNIIYYYLSLVEPEKYSLCKECGKIIKLTSNRQKYCRDCWKNINQEQTKLRVQKYRQCNALGFFKNL